jgi:hypothetical protein
MSLLADQIKAALKQRRDRFIKEQIAEIKSNRELAPYEYDIHSFELGIDPGADSMLPLILKLVEALDKVNNSLTDTYGMKLIA